MQKIADILNSCGIKIFGACKFSALSERLISCRAMNRLPENAQTVICMLFPYRCEIGAHNVSRYAVVRDYHLVVGKMIETAVLGLKKRFSQNNFAHFCDNSPIDEKFAAAICGLGVLGDNGLIINETYGSWVFIGEIVTDLALTTKEHEPKGCLHCGACKKACPAGALKVSPFNPENCLSFITQKKKALSPEEEALVIKGGLAWGCDVCQECCPMNKPAKNTYITQFLEGCVPIVCAEDYDSYSDRAFTWRPKRVITRNLELLK